MKSGDLVLSQLAADKERTRAGGGVEAVEHSPGFWKVSLLHGGVECHEDQARQARALTREQTQPFWDGPGMGRGWAVTKNRPGSIPGVPMESAGVEQGGVPFP